ncbi:MAG: ABC transporter permease subunit, partial [Planctomycetales bacterium]
MIWFLAKRLMWMALTLWIVFTISFFLMRAVPGGPFSSDRALSPAMEKNFKAKYQLDQPISVQYAVHLWRTVRLDLGMSFRMGDFTVNEIIAQGFPVSASLGILSMAFALSLGLTAGTLSALWRGGFADHAVMAAATMGVALPNFVIASGCIFLFVFMATIFPAECWGSMSQLVLPSLALGGPYAAYIARLTRTGMLDVLGQDYIRTAVAKGLPTHQVVLRHALRGAMLPVVSFLGPAMAGILTGSIVVERIFFIPGLGSHFVEGALQRDYTVAMGMVLIYTTLLYTMNMLVDLCYSLLDP